MKAAEAKDEDTAAWMVRSAAKETGRFFSNKRGYPINLYHGTKHFGWTEFDTEHTGNGLGDIRTTNNRSVAAGYSEFGHDRGAGSKYIQDDGTDATLIKNARNVLNQQGDTAPS